MVARSFDAGMAMMLPMLTLVSTCFSPVVWMIPVSHSAAEFVKVTVLPKGLKLRPSTLRPLHPAFHVRAQTLKLSSAAGKG